MVMATITAADRYLPDVDEDTRPGHYYVSVIDGSRYALLAGPYASHKEALGAVRAANDAACKLDARAHWYAFGTCRLLPAESPPRAILGKV